MVHLRYVFEKENFQVSNNACYYDYYSLVKFSGALRNEGLGKKVIFQQIRDLPTYTSVGLVVPSVGSPLDAAPVTVIQRAKLKKAFIRVTILILLLFRTTKYDQP